MLWGVGLAQSYGGKREREQRQRVPTRDCECVRVELDSMEEKNHEFLLFFAHGARSPKGGKGVRRPPPRKYLRSKPTYAGDFQSSSFSSTFAFSEDSPAVGFAVSEPPAFAWFSALAASSVAAAATHAGAPAKAPMQEG